MFYLNVLSLLAKKLLNFALNILTNITFKAKLSYTYKVILSVTIIFILSDVHCSLFHNHNVKLYGFNCLMSKIFQMAYVVRLGYQGSFINVIGWGFADLLQFNYFL